jgi:hypothetical protein
MATLTEFAVDERLMAALAPCIDHHGIGDPALYEWPSNVLSANTVAYASGVIARRGTAVDHRVDPEELVRCKALAAEIHAFVDDIDVGMKSEADDRWVPFFQVANEGADVPRALDEATVRARFGGTIMPIDRIVIEPLEEAGGWWEDLQSGEDPEVEDRWRQLIAFVAKHPLLHGGCFVQIGFYDYAPSGLAETEPLDFEGDAPAGYEMRGSCLPRLALAITECGSLVGVFGHVVWT